LFEGNAFNASDASGINRNYDGEWWIKQNLLEQSWLMGLIYTEYEQGLGTILGLFCDLICCNYSLCVT
jgi:hypothetical protein